jgi:integrase/recombinase XerC
MIRHPAKVLEPADLCRVLKHVKHTRHPLRNQVIVLLSFKAGLRACEIAGLDWSMVLRTTGKVGHVMRIGKHIAKGEYPRLCVWGLAHAVKTDHLLNRSG